MAIHLSLQGCMAAGKTTAARYVAARRPHVDISFENPRPMLDEAARQGLRQDTPEGFAAIQRLFIQAELTRYARAEEGFCTLYDMGAEEIEFYSLFYPQSMGYDWDVEALLGPELAALRACRQDGVLFLRASRETLVRNKEADATRPRSIFDHYLNRMLPLKEAWFAARRNPPTDYLDVDGLDAAQVDEAVLRWVDAFL